MSRIVIVILIYRRHKPIDLIPHYYSRIVPRNYSSCTSRAGSPAVTYTLPVTRSERERVRTGSVAMNQRDNYSATGDDEVGSSRQPWLRSERPATGSSLRSIAPSAARATVC
jgi:hypothetical protein